MTAQEKPLHIDIPVKLTDVGVVFSVASLSFVYSTHCWSEN